MNPLIERNSDQDLANSGTGERNCKVSDDVFPSIRLFCDEEVFQDRYACAAIRFSVASCRLPGHHL